MIEVGPSKEAIKEARESIVRILSDGRSDQVILVALEVFRDVCKVENVKIENNTFSAK